MRSTISKIPEKQLPRIGITMGDPAGIGPEICLAAISDPEILQLCTPILFGDSLILERAENNRIAPLAELKTVELAKLSEFDKRFSKPTLVDFSTDDIESVSFAAVSAIAGDAAFNYINTAIDWHLQHRVDAIVTGPINKLALHAAGHHFPGHTEIFATRTDTPNYCMMQYSDELTCAFATTHVGYQDVPDLLTIDRIVDVIRLIAAALRVFRGCNPKIVVCGLNPHAGEDGLFGEGEEERIIAPAIEIARQSGIDVTGPFPPDTCFIPSRRKTTDGFVCMYHDQGHIPLKALVFDKAVNVTLGLPIIRTSVDHGTAFDIAGKNLADPSSIKQAIHLAAKMAEHRRQTGGARIGSD